MRTSTIFTTLFIARKSKSKAKNTIGILYLRITYNSKPLEFSLGKRIDISLWDSGKGRMKSNTKEAKEINEYISTTKAELRNIYEELRRSKSFISVETIKSLYLNQDNTVPTLKDIIKYHYETASVTIRPGTLKNYRTTEVYINKFLSDKMKVDDIYLSQISYSFITKFENFLRLYEPVDHQKKMSNNTVMKHLQRLRKIIGLAVRLEWIEKDPFANFKAHFVKKERGFLSAIELASIEDKQFSIPRLQLVKDLFVFSCYTGLSYIDVVSLTSDNIVVGIDGGTWIITNRVKTDNPVKIPLLPKAEDILQKYENNPKALHQNRCFPKISNQKMNSYLKEIADLCGITKNVTFHLARHTFATTVTLANNVPISTVSKMLGHSKITTTQIYAKVLESKVSQDMLILKEKLNSKNINQVNRVNIG